MASFSPLSHCKSKQLQRRVEQLFGWIFIRDHRVVGNLEASLGQEEPGSLASFKSIRCGIRIVRDMRHTRHMRIYAIVFQACSSDTWKFPRTSFDSKLGILQLLCRRQCWGQYAKGVLPDRESPMRIKSSDKVSQVWSCCGIVQIKQFLTTL